MLFGELRSGPLRIETLTLELHAVSMRYALDWYAGLDINRGKHGPRSDSAQPRLAGCSWPEHERPVRQVVTWTNTSSQPVDKIVFNAHAHYSVPDSDIGFMAKTLEILRLSPKESLSLDGPALEFDDVRMQNGGQTLKLVK